MLFVYTGSRARGNHEGDVIPRLSASGVRVPQDPGPVLVLEPFPNRFRAKSPEFGPMRDWEVALGKWLRLRLGTIKQRLITAANFELRAFHGSELFG